MREVISIHVGQAGIQLGTTCWELFCLEHEIQPDGQISPDKSISNDECLNAFYSETKEGNWLARAAFVDLEPLIIYETMYGPNRKLFQPNRFIYGKEDASNNFGRGHSSIGRNIIDPSLEVIRKIAEDCEELQGFLIYHSLGGGTGSGLGSLILERLSQEYSQKTKINFSIWPSGKNSVAVVEPYNATLSMHALKNDSDAAIILDNEAIYEICKKQLNVVRPNYTVLNRLIALGISSMTTSMRYNGTVNANLSEFTSSLVPSPNFHFLFPSYAPVISTDHQCGPNISVMEMTREVFQVENAWAKCDPKNGKYLAYSLNYRGDASYEDASFAIANLEPIKTVEFADWCPAGAKFAINDKKIAAITDKHLGQSPRTISMINNNTSITEVFDRIGHKFELLYCKRAYVYWYISEGMEEHEFNEAFEDMKTIETEYNSLCNMPESSINDLDAGEI
ncbi:unnamed protein product [Blepharisma stoltei]|uniref:Tubulin alpha chain n=1 Tax=Blepharisma stoltei TaxID=1481888 RepID=A0AAU9J1V3_9CILI|nr:unnamed protein product [Blepharisma stoltei]